MQIWIEFSSKGPSISPQDEHDTIAIHRSFLTTCHSMSIVIVTENMALNRGPLFLQDYRPCHRIISSALINVCSSTRPPSGHACISVILTSEVSGYSPNKQAGHSASAAIVSLPSGIDMNGKKAGGTSNPMSLQAASELTVPRRSILCRHGRYVEVGY
jgi:hypothetical protein